MNDEAKEYRPDAIPKTLDREARLDALEEDVAILKVAVRDLSRQLEELKHA